MNKIVLDHYPVENLPDDIRKVVAGAGLVKVTIEPERPHPISRDALVQELKAAKLELQDGQGKSIDEATEQIRRLRDEWED